MPRPVSLGLKFFYLDAGFFQDRKVRRLQRKCGENAPLIYIALLCMIYTEGYYIHWDDDLCFDISETLKIDEECVRRVIEGCLEVGLLSNYMYERHSILTSHGIQKQYKLTCEHCKRKASVSEFSLLVSSEETPENEQNDDISSEETPENEQNDDISSEETPENCQNNEFTPKEVHKEKKSKEEYSIEENTSSSLSSPSVEEEQQQEGFVSKMEMDGFAIEECKWRYRIQLEFLKRNYPNPDEEYERFIAYNNTGGRRWARMDCVQRDAALSLWTARDSSPRFPSAIHDFLYTIAYRVCLHLRDRDIPVALELVSSKVDVQLDKAYLVFFCSRALSEYLERSLNRFSDAYEKVIKKMHVNNIRYANPNNINTITAERAAQG